jgi:putative nucleotidyltransferase with HDIG domain
MDSSNQELERLLTIIGNVAAGEYSDEILALTTDTTPETIRVIAEAMGLEEDQVSLVRTAGILHDIGKIGCSDRIFQAHDAKNPSDVVKEIIAHPTVGAEILKNLDFLGGVTEIIYAHHERMDGKGYPRGLTPDKIPLGARIIAVADSYDAMTNDRPYQKAMSHEAALEILRKIAGIKLDAGCVSAFERLKR